MASNSNKRKNRIGKEYDDDDEINKSIREFQGQGSSSGEEENSEPENDQDEFVEDELPPGKVANNAPPPTIPGVVGRIVIEDEYDENGQDGDLDAIDLDAKKMVVADEDLKLPECSCCGAKWTVSAGIIKNGCGCRIHPTCDTCGKCKGHCDVTIGHERTVRA